LQEQLDDPAGHDVLLQASRCGVPICVMHGDRDDAVDLLAGKAITHKLNKPLIVLQDSNHVLNLSNPSNIDGPRSVPLLKAIDEIVRFIGQHNDRGSG
jgi:pimeloyl-ACP methyl ester carboxylesterase